MRISRGSRRLLTAALAAALVLAVVLSHGPSLAHARMVQGHRDVCVLGAGAAGMSAAVFLKDAGRSVVVLESDTKVGGQCETLHFRPPNAGVPDWIDVGVQYFANTTAANAAGLGPWVLDSVAFAERFAGPDSAVPLDFATDTTPNYAVDLGLGLSLGRQNSTPPTPEFLSALGRFQAIIASYPWLDLAAVPDPVPAELLVPFSQFIANHQLEPLVLPMFVPQLFAGGLGDFDRLATLYALLNLAPTVQYIFSAPDAGFVVYGGCETIYNGMAQYLGEDNVHTSARVSLAVRLFHERAPVIITGFLNESCPFVYTCDKLIVSYAQVADRMGPLQLDEREQEVFAAVRDRYYFTGEVEIEGPLDSVGAFNLLNYRLPQSPSGPPLSTPTLPAITQMTRGLPYGPAQVKASSNDPITLEEMENVLGEQLSRFPASLLTQVRLVKLIRHVFQPHFTDASLAEPHGNYQALHQLQGHRNTYYLGSLIRFPITYQLWDYSKRFVDEHFADFTPLATPE